MTSEATDHRRWPLTELGSAVESAVLGLQRGVLADYRDGSAGASLARLRRAVAKEPGSVPEVWDHTIDIVPLAMRGSDGPVAAERAAHLAVTLYALHQQGRTRPMHSQGGSIGSAARTLVRATDREDAVRRRFHAIALADTDNAIVHHLRSLVTLLKSENISLDYGRLADDLAVLFARKKTDSVRIRWGRDFRRIAATPSADLADSNDTHEEE